MMRKMKARGVAIVYISHRMEEVFSECDTITVMRDGHTIITKPTAEISVDEVVRHMVGRSIDEFYPARTTTPGEVVMSVDNLQPEGFEDVYKRQSLAFSRPTSKRVMVVLPQPLRPPMAIYSPPSMVKVTSRKISTDGT